MAVSVDIIDGARGRRYFGEYGQRMWEFTRVAVVHGLAPSSNPPDLVERAVDAVIDVVGDLGSSFPGRELCLLREFVPEVLSSESVRVSIVYRDVPAQATSIEVGASVSQVETNKDRYGNTIQLSYVYPGQTEPTVQGGIYTKFVPEVTLVVRRTEYESPLVKASNNVGKVNSTDFAGLPARRWLCTSIVGRSGDGGFSYDTSYTFQAREDPWDPTLVFILPETGKPPPETDENSEKQVEAYNEANFNEFDLFS